MRDILPLFLPECRPQRFTRWLIVPAIADAARDGFPGVSLKPGQFQPFLVYIGIDGVHIGVPTTLYVWGR